MLSEDAKGIAAAVARAIADKIEELSEELRKDARKDAEHRLVPIDVTHLELPVSFTSAMGGRGNPLSALLNSENLPPSNEKIAHTIALLRCDHCGAVGNQVLLGSWDLDQLLGKSMRGAIDKLTAAAS